MVSCVVETLVYLQFFGLWLENCNPQIVTLPPTRSRAEELDWLKDQTLSASSVIFWLHARFLLVIAPWIN